MAPEPHSRADCFSRSMRRLLLEKRGFCARMSTRTDAPRFRGAPWLSNFQGTPTVECQPCNQYYPSTATFPPPKRTHMRLKRLILHLRTIQLVFPVGAACLRMQQKLAIGPEAPANGTVGRCQGLMSRIHEKGRLQLVDCVDLER
ncbi:hypothetical protein BN1723_015725 [Verticillium longisporum]|uniref:Uncharacterized protein n=1 Tax=Verticillium longisporum TaxID=100787 RepID=A0A0G4N1W0_VERLO|nr:hypothetical protein BN1723_015725 [Verticillium longisporum]